MGTVLSILGVSSCGGEVVSISFSFSTMAVVVVVVVVSFLRGSCFCLAFGLSLCCLGSSVGLPHLILP